MTYDKIIETLISYGCTDSQIVSRFTEMPHITLGGQPFDVELEAHLSDPQELIRYFKKVLAGELFDYKYGTNVRLTPGQRKELKQFLLTDKTVQILLTKKYSKDIYKQFISAVR